MKIFCQRHPSSTGIQSEDNQPFFQRKGDSLTANAAHAAFFSGGVKLYGSKGLVSSQASQGIIQKQDAGTPAVDAGTPYPDAGTPAPDGGATITDAGTTIHENPQHPACYDRTLSATEIEQRLSIYQDMVRGISDPISQRNAILQAMCSFSIHQLTMMQEAGVRFWPRGSFPPLNLPEDVVLEASGGGLGAYMPRIRTIRLSGNSVSVFTHELAHAWDHVRVMPRRRRLDDLSPERVEREITNAPVLGSTTTTRYGVEIDSGRTRMSIGQMFDAFMARMNGRPRDQAFGSPNAADGYSLSRVQDFYAEGYAVFYGRWPDERQTMRRQAPELYEYFRQEAIREGLPVPT